MKRILITGASGFFGRSVIKALRNSSEDVEVVCVSHKSLLDDERFQSVQCNLLDEGEIKHLIEQFKPTHCIHLAWYVPPQQFWQAQENNDWLKVSITLFDIFCENGGEVFLGAGTLAEYDWSSGLLDEEKTVLNPNTLYGQCKKSLYESIITLRNEVYSNTKIIWPRIGYFFGPHEPKEKLISKLIDHLKNDMPLFLASTEFKRPYAHVDYLGEIMCKLILHELQGEDMVFNLSAKKSYALQEIVEFLQKIMSAHSSKIIYGAYPSSPDSLTVNADFLQRNGLDIPNTFFADLEKIVSNNA